MRLINLLSNVTVFYHLVLVQVLVQSTIVTGSTLTAGMLGNRYIGLIQQQMLVQITFTSSDATVLTTLYRIF
jgi:hypothetical protein